MSLWPFRRKSRRKRSRGSPADLDSLRDQIVEPARMPRRQQTLPDAMAIDAAAPQSVLKKQHSEPNKLHRRPRTYSFSPGRQDSVHLGRRRSTRSKRDKREPTRAYPDATPADYAVRVHYKWTHYDDDGEKVAPDARTPALGGAHQRGPTLHNKREGDHLPRKKSSKKRRKEEHIREAEIKAMSNFMPVRSATEDWASARAATTKKDIKRTKTGFGLGFRGGARHEWDKENRSSDVSLPPAESIHSSLSSDSEHITFKLSALEALAPRPTLHYAVNPREPSDSSLRGARPSNKLSTPIPEATLKAHKRIRELADDLSASDLRELMERDQRRRERKQQQDQAKMERRLARRAEKQKAEEEAAMREGRESPPNLERGVLGREVVGLGIESTSAVVTSSKRRSSESMASRRQEKAAEAGGVIETDEGARPEPLDAFHRTTSIVAEPEVLPVPSGPVDEPTEPEPEPAPAPAPLPAPSRTSSRKSLNIFRRLSRSKSPQTLEAKATASETSRKASESSSSRVPVSWTSIFRWGSKNKRNSGGPSSFSNTSRDSMLTAQHPTPPPQSMVPRKISSGVPKRTMSRFREDLPELPRSPPPPVSQAQSRELEPIPPTIVEASPDTSSHVVGMTFAPAAQGPRYDTPTSGYRSIDAMRRTPSSFSYHDEAGQQTSPTVSPEPQSMSLASIDSEGSWLSGRVGKKRHSSGILETSHRGVYSHRESGSDKSNFNERITNEETSADDEFAAQFAHNNQTEQPSWNCKSTGETVLSSDADEEDARWGAVSGHQPTLVHTTSHMKSHEVLLNPFEEEAEEEQQGANIADDENVQRATSVNLSPGHVRHISAGSARLLSITPRSSVEVKGGSPKSS